MVESEPAIYQLKITLRGTRPPVWRRFQVRNDITFYDLHEILQVVMGWQDYHLHQFEVEGQPIGDAETLLAFDERGVSEEAKLHEIISRREQIFTYEYDFGDGWKHNLILEEVLPVNADIKYPRCLAGRRACPPEDVGGVWAYQFFLEAIRDPEHEDHESYIDWIGGEFDPEYFDVAEVNRRLG